MATKAAVVSAFWATTNAAASTFSLRDLDLIIGNIEGQVLLAINEGDRQKPVVRRAVPCSAGGARNQGR